MALCESCQKLQIQLLPDSDDRRGGAKLTAFCHSTAAALLKRSQRCALCALIMNSFLRVGSYYIKKDMVEKKLKEAAKAPVLLSARRKDGRRTLEGGANIESVETLVNDENERFRGRFHLWAAHDSPAIFSGDVVKRPLLIEGSSIKPSELVRQWLDTCISDHDECRFSSASEDLVDRKRPVLPKRLIQTFEDKLGDFRRVHPRLIKPDQKFFRRYVTLSHCWGPPTKRPLRTTTSNLSQHLQEIPWDSLPLTFRDAITLCAEVGIQHLWIDSLCIVQDDAADWAEESVKMGEIYEEAHFTIAASSASDSSYGLFAVRKPISLVKVPYYHSGGSVNSVFAYIEPELEKDLSGAPLNNRAWVMQEYYLSRRTVHFTQNGLMWTCKSQNVPTRRYITTEFGDFWAKAFENNWSALVSSYSKRQLTYKSDKLVALQGLEEVFRKRHNKTYCYGLWLEDLPQELLWYSDDKLVRDVGIGIPSWTWASTTGTISFKSSEFENPRPIYEHLTVSSASGTLKMRSTITLIEDIQGPLECRAYCVEDLHDMDFTGRVHDEYKSASISVSPTFLLILEQQKVGWGVFDGFDRPSKPIYALCLLKQRVPEWFPGSRERHFVWALLVQHIDKECTYERVGWGLILALSCVDFVNLQDVYLV